MSDGRSRTQGFLALTEAQRSRFVQDNFGFLADVTEALAAEGVVNENGKPYSRATVLRTWYSKFNSPNPRIIAALEVHYRRILNRDYKRRVREPALA